MPYNPKEALKPYKQNANDKFPTQIAEGMKLESASASKLIELLSPIFDDDDLVSLAKDLLDKIEERTKKIAQDQTQGQIDNANQSEAQKLASNRIEANAQTSQQFPEPKVSDTLYTSPIDLPPSDSAFGEDYPNSYGSINDIGDFFKVNKTAGSVFLQHHSGTKLKVDNQGNVTIYANSTKIVTKSDLAISVGGGLDISAKKGIYLHSNEITMSADSKVVLDTLQIEALQTLQFDLAQASIVKAGTFKGYALLSAPAISLG